MILGFILGVIASFLGIGGGPLNLSSLNFFAGINLQLSAIYSIFIIVFTQSANLLRWGIAGVINEGSWGWPAVAAHLTMAVIIGSVIGGLIGTVIQRRIKTGANSENILRWVYVGALILTLVLTVLVLFGVEVVFFPN